MGKNNLPDLSLLWPISLVLGAVIIVLIPVFIGASIKSSDWIGFAGNVVAGTMTLVAAMVAWVAVQKQIAIQKKIADGQGALQRFLIFQQQLETFEGDLRLTDIVERQGKEVPSVQEAYFAGPSVQRWQVNNARKELEARKLGLEEADRSFTLFSSPRWALAESVKTRKDVIGKLDDLKSAVAAARQALAAIPKGAAQISAQDAKTCLAINVKNEVDALHAACRAHHRVIRTEIRRLEGLIEDMRRTAGLSQ